MEIILGLAGLATLGWMIYWLHCSTNRHPFHKWYFPFLLLKLVSGIALGIIYFYYYGSGDTLSYHHDAIIGSEIAFDRFPDFIRMIFSRASVEGMHFHNQPRALFISKILSIAYIFSLRNYWLASLFFSFFSFAGLWFLANFLVQKKSFHKTATAIAFFLCPSIVFWSSGILKESLMMGSIGFLLYYFLKWTELRKITLWEGLFSILLMAAIWKIKYYYAAVLFPSMIGYAAIKFGQPEPFLYKNNWTSLAAYLAVFCAILLLATFLHPNLRLDRMIHVLTENYEIVTSLSRPGTSIHFADLAPTWQGIVKNLPQAIVGGLFRPFIWEAHSIPACLAAIENMLILLASLIALSQTGKCAKTGNFLLVFVALIYVLIMASLLAISTPNFGSLSRYKVGFIPFLLLAILDPVLRLFAGNKNKSSLQ